MLMLLDNCRHFNIYIDISIKATLKWHNFVVGLVNLALENEVGGTWGQEVKFLDRTLFYFWL